MEPSEKRNEDLRRTQVDEKVLIVALELAGSRIGQRHEGSDCLSGALYAEALLAMNQIPGKTWADYFPTVRLAHLSGYEEDTANMFLDALHEWVNLKTKNPEYCASFSQLSVQKALETGCEFAKFAISRDVHISRKNLAYFCHLNPHGSKNFKPPAETPNEIVLDLYGFGLFRDLSFGDRDEVI